MAPNLILIGFMASGKTSVGRKVAAALGWRFRDADTEIEKHAGRPVSEIFAQSGEQGFRQQEEQAVLRLLEEGAEAEGGGTVLSLGGGAVTNPALLARLRGEPLVVFLDQDVETAFGRAQSGRRPLAKDAERFRELYRLRQPLYAEAASVTVNVRGRTVQQLAGEIAGLVKERTDKT